MIIWVKDVDAPKLKVVSKTYNIWGKNITFESGKIALLIDWSVVIRDEDWNYLLTTAGVKEIKETPANIDLALTVDFVEKYYATGKIWWNRFMKREARPSENATLNSRIIDRPIRPMFPKWTLNEIQIISTILSSSWSWDYGFFAISWASLALMLAWCTEFEWPISGARIILDKNNTFKFDPSIDDLKDCKLDLTIAGTLDSITMVESQCYEIDDNIILDAFNYAHDIIKTFCNAQIDFIEEYKKIYALPKSKLIIKSPNEILYKKIKDYITDTKIEPLYNTWKIEFHEKLVELENDVKQFLWYVEDNEEMKENEIEEFVYKTVKTYMRKNILEKKARLDGRNLDEVRSIKTEFWILPRVHWSALFQRWITQALSVATLGWPKDIMLVDDMFEENSKRYIHHYNFPPFSTWEVKGLRGWPTRRDIWHGRLAEKALEPVLPSLEEFPYFIRVVSEVTTCNWSSSMASVCGSSMSLMDAWVPIKNIVSWVAMWMIYDDETWKYEILTDIQAQEDFLWDMDFKVAWTDKWITALQMDCKIKGLKMDVIKTVLEKSKVAIDFIRTEMIKDLQAPRANLSPFAPSILMIKVPVEKIKEIIGRGWETIQKIQKDYEVEIQVNNENWALSVTAKNQEQWKNAIDFISNLIKDIEVGDVCTGKIARIISWVWAIVDFGNNKNGMIHISKIAKERVNNIEDYLKTWDIVKVRVLTVDKAEWRVGLERIV
jgi:polyribonucleotide nucleotidyltransferase